MNATGAMHRLMTALGLQGASPVRKGPLTWAISAIAAASVASAAGEAHNLILFVPDGLRSQIVDTETAPTMARLRAEGVDFRNSHSLFPTFTTANASAFATGHELGDTGDFSNDIYTGVRVLSGNATVTPFLENDAVLKEVNHQFDGNYLDETAIVAVAREKGYGTALIGKLGPTVIFDLAALTSDPPSSEEGTLVIDDATGIAGQGVPLSGAWKAAFAQAKVGQIAPGRGDNSNSGDASQPGTWVPNLTQEQYFLEVALKVALPHFQKSGKPFVMVFWSREPDGTQHNQGDSFHSVDPGINGPTSLAAIRNADGALDLIEATLRRLNLYENTNIIIAADHGFSTIQKSGTDSFSVKGVYKDVKSGELPPGFLAIDLYADLKNSDPDLRLFDPDAGYREIHSGDGTHPLHGNGLIGADADHPKVVVAAGGGSDLLYLPSEPPVWQRTALKPHPAHSAAERHQDRALVERIVAALCKHDYISGIFIDTQRFGIIPGALSLGAIGLQGHAVTPHPDLIVNFSSKLVPSCRLDASLCAEEVADTTLIEGQGMHGSFSRADTWNFMAARGPDFKKGFVDSLPASNADVGMTMARLLGIDPPRHGTLAGRVLTEALEASNHEQKLPEVTVRTIDSPPTPAGLRTLVKVQILGNEVYLDAGGFPDRTVGLH